MYTRIYPRASRALDSLNNLCMCHPAAATSPSTCTLYDKKTLENILEVAPVMHKVRFETDSVAESCMEGPQQRLEHLWKHSNAAAQSLKTMSETVKLALRGTKEQRLALERRKRRPAPPWRRPNRPAQTLKRTPKAW